MKSQRDAVGLIGGALLILSLFMPWISAGALSEKAIDTPNGYLMLSLGVVACIVALINIIKNTSSKVSFVYPLSGALSAWLLFINYGDLARRADRVATDLPFMSHFIHGFIGPGVYVGLIGCAVLVCSIFFKSE